MELTVTTLTGEAAGSITVSDRSPILDIETRNFGEYSGDMSLQFQPPRRWCPWWVTRIMLKGMGKSIPVTTPRARLI